MNTKKLSNECIPSKRPLEASRSQGLRREEAVEVVVRVPLPVAPNPELVAIKDCVEVLEPVLEVCQGLGGLVVVMSRKSCLADKLGNKLTVSSRYSYQRQLIPRCISLLMLNSKARILNNVPKGQNRQEFDFSQKIRVFLTSVRA